MQRLRSISVGLTLVLVAQGAFAADGEEDPTPVGSLTTTGSLAQARTGHDAALLPDGRVLVSGGDDPAAPAELYEPATATFLPADPETISSAGPGIEPPALPDVTREGHTATLLPDGRVLLVGGSGGDGASVEVYDPATGTSEHAGTLATPRSGHTATFLRDGRVLIAGGSGADGPVAGAELWVSATPAAKCFGKRPTLFAMPGVRMVGSGKADIIVGSVGDDVIGGGGGDDLICAGAGSDVIDGGKGNDKIDGGAGTDRLIGGKGKDRCIASKGTDWQDGCDQRQTRGIVELKRNTKLKGPHKGRFVIGRNGITLDCRGHVVTGPGRNAGLPGIWLDKRKNVKVKNCDLRNFNDAFRVVKSRGNTFSDNRVAHVRQGFTLQGSHKNKIIGNLVHDATDFFGYGLGGSNDNLLRDNEATNIGGVAYGVFAGKRNVLDGNVARESGLGFGTWNDGVDDNTFSRNASIDNRKAFEDQTWVWDGGGQARNRWTGNTCTGGGSAGSTPPVDC